MESAPKSPERLGIYFFYDPDGVVDDYVTEFLADMAPNLTDLVIVSNGDLSEEAIKRLWPFTDNLIARDNQGFDVGAYREAMESVGWDNLATYDEVILMNSTIMGPVYPFAEMFADMDQRDVDFWGITAHHAVEGDPFGFLPDARIPWHIQSHFMVFRRSLVSDPSFRRYWDELPEIKSYNDSVAFHEISCTKHFNELGFKSEVYVDTTDLESFTYHPISMVPRELVQNRRSPIFKRRSFFADYRHILSSSAGTPARDLYTFLRDSSEYDVDLIWKNALRTMNLVDIVRNLHLNYVLPTEVVESEPSFPGPRVALVAHVYYMELFDEMLGYITSMPENSDVIVTTDTEEKCNLIQELMASTPYRVETRVVPNRGRDVSALLVGARDVLDKYDLVCFIHDKKVTQLQPLSVGAGFAEKCFENLLATPAFVKNVISLFEAEPRLGMLMPTPPNHADYFGGHADSWGPNFDNTVSLLDDLGITVPLSRDKAPIAPLGGMFWFRPSAMAALFERDWDYEDFPPEPSFTDGALPHAIERSRCYVAQGLGYYSGWLYSDRFASVELTNLTYQLQEMTSAVSGIVPLGSLVSVTDQLRSIGAPGQAAPAPDVVADLQTRLYHAELNASFKHRLKQAIKMAIPASVHPRIRKAVNTLKGVE